MSPRRRPATRQTLRRSADAGRPTRAPACWPPCRSQRSARATRITNRTRDAATRPGRGSKSNASDPSVPCVARLRGVRSGVAGIATTPRAIRSSASVQWDGIAEQLTSAFGSPPFATFCGRPGRAQESPPRHWRVGHSSSSSSSGPELSSSSGPSASRSASSCS